MTNHPPPPHISSTSTNFAIQAASASEPPPSYSKLPQPITDDTSPPPYAAANLYPPWAVTPVSRSRQPIANSVQITNSPLPPYQYRRHKAILLLLTTIASVCAVVALVAPWVLLEYKYTWNLREHSDLLPTDNDTVRLQFSLIRPLQQWITHNGSTTYSSGSWWNLQYPTPGSFDPGNWYAPDLINPLVDEPLLLWWFGVLPFLGLGLLMTLGNVVFVKGERVVHWCCYCCVGGVGARVIGFFLLISAICQTFYLNRLSNPARYFVDGTFIGITWLTGGDFSILCCVMTFAAALWATGGRWFFRRKAQMARAFGGV
ncbi:hypothetical protein HDV00_010863 [Rhizophlyctis rosea]|nr:hypothetical protein HDV00_010863 [Rhizophlyctis rosea]